MTEDEGFLQRWSRRKHTSVEKEKAADKVDEHEGQDEPVKEGELPLAEADVEPRDVSEADDGEPEAPGDEDMPPLESIDQGGSVTPFMSPRVTEGLRRAALRRLFRQPKYNVVDMLDDYAEDYSTPVPLGDIVTSDMRYRAEQAAKRMKEKLKESLAEEDAGGSEMAEPGHEVSDGNIASSNSADQPHDSVSDQSSDAGADQIANTGEVKTLGEDSPEDPNQKPA
jgi:hypothetical protein